MQEEWRIVPSAPNYEVSSLGEVRNIRTKLIRRSSLNKEGFAKLTVHIEGEHQTRTVASLVADAFFGIDYKPTFNSIIHLNTNRQDCRPDNLARRPRSFAIEYHRQFNPRELAKWGPMNIKYRLLGTDEVFANITIPAKRYGLLCRKIFYSAANRGGEQVFPTGLRFVFDHW